MAASSEELWEPDRLEHPQRHLPLIGREIPGRQHIQESLLSKREMSIQNDQYFRAIINLSIPFKVKQVTM